MQLSLCQGNDALSEAPKSHCSLKDALGCSCQFVPLFLYALLLGITLSDIIGLSVKCLRRICVLSSIFSSTVSTIFIYRYDMSFCKISWQKVFLFTLVILCSLLTRFDCNRQFSQFFLFTARANCDDLGVQSPINAVC